MSNDPNDRSVNDMTSAAGRTADDFERLHRLHDGELSPEERVRAEAALDDADRLRLSALSDIGAALRNTYAVQAESFDAWPALQKRIGDSKVVSLTERLSRRRVPIGVSTFLAAAAALVVLVGPWRDVLPTNGCDIESIDARGADVSVLKVPDPNSGEGTATIVWMHETD